MSHIKVENIVVGVGVGGIIGSVLLGHRLKWNRVAKGLLVGSALFTLGAAIKFSASPMTQNQESLLKNFKLNEKNQLYGTYVNKVGEDYLVKSDVFFTIFKQGSDFENTEYQISSTAFDNPRVLFGAELEKASWGEAAATLKYYFNIMKID